MRKLAIRGTNDLIACSSPAQGKQYRQRFSTTQRLASMMASGVLDIVEAQINGHAGFERFERIARSLYQAIQYIDIFAGT
jgi:hypothetical protein